MTRQKGFNKTRFEAKARLIDTVRVFSLYTHLIAMTFEICFETHSFCNCCFNYATKSKSCHHHTNFMIHTSSTCRVEKIRVQPFEIIIFVDTPISFVFKLDKRPLNGQKENEIVILYTLQVQRKKLWHDTTILFFIKDNDSFCIATNISSSRAPSNYRTIIKKRFLHAKTLAAAAAAAAASTTTICERAMHACTRPLLERFAKRHSLLFLFFFVLT